MQQYRPVIDSLVMLLIGKRPTEFTWRNDDASSKWTYIGSMLPQIPLPQSVCSPFLPWPALSSSCIFFYPSFRPVTFCGLSAPFPRRLLWAWSWPTRTSRQARPDWAASSRAGTASSSPSFTRRPRSRRGHRPTGGPPAGDGALKPDSTLTELQLLEGFMGYF